MPTTRNDDSRYRKSPELECEPSRIHALGYEPLEEAGFIRYLEHGYPTPLARWHYHDEFELHLITSTSGRVFVGDYIGHFEPGHLVLVGPRVPHNWISDDVPAGGIKQRDLVIQFPYAPFKEGVKLIPELAELLPFLQKTSHGIEFYNLSSQAEQFFYKIRAAHGVQCMIVFYEFLLLLTRCSHYRLLSNNPFDSREDDASLECINNLVHEILENTDEEFYAAEIAQRFNMSESAFSRFFSKATGNTFTDFVNRIRISQACLLLMETNDYISNICYAVGFKNLANFNRRFLQIKGVSPKVYRQQVSARFGTANNHSLRRAH